MKYTERHGRLYKRIFAQEQSTFGRDEKPSVRAVMRQADRIWELPEGSRILEDMREHHASLITQEFRL